MAGSTDVINNNDGSILFRCSSLKRLSLLTGTVYCNRAIVGVVSCAFPAMTSQKDCCEKKAPFGALMTLCNVFKCLYVSLIP